MMNNEKMYINFAPGQNRAELIVREGQAPKVLEVKPPVKTDISGVIGTVLEYLVKRVSTGQFKQERSHIIVNRDMVSIKLIINEDDEYNRGEITGKLEIHPKFKEFGINTNKAWTPTELGMFFKMNRSFFANKSENMTLVSSLMNFTAEVNNKIERSIKENGNRTDNFAQIVNSNLPESFNIVIPIFKGTDAEIIEVETMAKIDGREVAFVLLSPGANVILEDLRNKVIDEQLEAIKKVAPEIAIIEE